jgi:hypothetical protein
MILTSSIGGVRCWCVSVGVLREGSNRRRRAIILDDRSVTRHVWAACIASVVDSDLWLFSIANPVKPRTR